MRQRCVLVTGAAGFVGQALASGFVDLGWKVIGLDRAFDGGGEGHGVERITGDLAYGIPTEVPAVDVVVHAAWVTTDPDTLGITAAGYSSLNLRPLLAILEYAARTRPTAFVFLSSSGAFASGDAREGLTDAHQPTGASPYAVSKRAGELLVPAALDADTAGHVVRLGYLFGPGEQVRPSRVGVSLVAGWLAAARDGQPLPVRSDDPARDWTFTPDLAPALERIVDGPSAGHPVHVGSPHVWTDAAFAALIASEFVMVSGEGMVKPPMVPSDIPALRGFEWTDPPGGLQALMTAEVAA